MGFFATRVAFLGPRFFFTFFAFFLALAMLPSREEYYRGSWVPPPISDHCGASFRPCAKTLKPESPDPVPMTSTPCSLMAARRTVEVDLLDVGPGHVLGALTAIDEDQHASIPLPQVTLALEVQLLAVSMEVHRGALSALPVGRGARLK